MSAGQASSPGKRPRRRNDHCQINRCRQDGRHATLAWWTILPPTPASVPAEIISHAVWLHHVFSLSLRDVELILAERGVLVTHESIRPGAPGTSTKCSSASGVCSTTCAHRRLERVMDAVQSAVVIPAAEIVIDRCEVEGLSAGLLTGSPCPGCTSPHSPLPERPPV